MRELLVACLILACAGCTTPQDVLKTDPIAIFLAHKPVEAISNCAIPKLRDVWPFAIATPIPGGTRIVATGKAWGPVPATVDIYESPTGTMVEVRLGPGHSNGISRKLESCM